MWPDYALTKYSIVSYTESLMDQPSKMLVIITLAIVNKNKLLTLVLG